MCNGFLYFVSLKVFWTASQSPREMMASWTPLIVQNLAHHAGVPLLLSPGSPPDGFLKALPLGIDGGDQHLLIPEFRVFCIVHISQRRPSNGVPLFAFRPYTGAHFSAHVLGVPLVHNIMEKRGGLSRPRPARCPPHC